MWKFELANSKAFCAAAYVYLRDNMNEWAMACNSRPFYHSLVEKGNVLLDAQRVQLQQQMPNVTIVPYCFAKAGVLFTSHAVSEAGECVVESHDVDLAVIIHLTAEGRVKLSFRSKPGVNVSVLAKRLGGGGHATAAGATVDYSFVTNLLQGTL